jgi:hypothetical protein
MIDFETGYRENPLSGSDNFSRRRMLQRTAAGFGMAALGGLLAGEKATAANPATAGRPNIAPRAKRVIFLFLNGGPSHIDTFDPKPALARLEGTQPSGRLYKPSKGSGFFPSPFSFRQCGRSGLPVSETLPGLSRIIDDCCVIRSMHTDVPNHEPALLQMHTGNIQPVRPSIGSWALYGLGTLNRNLPGYVVLRPSPNIVVGPALWSSSFLPAQFQATSVMTEDMDVEKLIANVRNPRYGLGQQRSQLDLLRDLNRFHADSRPGEKDLEAQIQSMETAYRMQIEATDAFDISGEPDYLKESYGDTAFARSCLLARRLVERGVRFVTVYYTGKSNQPWDTHSHHNSQHPKLCADADKAGAALIADLKSRGLLEDTLVLWGGEFGRTPYAEQDRNSNKDKTGRDHHHTAFSMLLAGGGIRGGTYYGKTDETGMEVSENPVHVHDLHATILHLLGIDHEELTYRYSGRDFRLTDVHGNVVNDIMA